MKRDISRREQLTVLVGESSRVNLGKLLVLGGGGLIRFHSFKMSQAKNIRSF